MSEGGDNVPVAGGSAASSLNNGANIAEGGSPPQNMLPSNRQTARPEYKELAERPVHNWQATKTTVKDRLSYLFNNEVLCDVHFIVGRGINQQRIPAHRFILSAGSAVFDAMFNGTLATAAAEENLPDVEPAAFLSLLRFLYTDEVRICPDTVMTTLYTAKKYAVPALERHCVDFLKKNLSSDNAFLLLTQARLFDEPQLAALCLEMIDKNAADALSADGFTDIDLETLIYVLERDTLRAPEFKLYEAAERWAKAECLRKQENVSPTNMRRLLGGAFQLIRFPLMRVEEFASGPAQSGLLTDREVVKLFLHFTVNPKPKAGFPENPRCCMSGTELTVSRFDQIENRWGYSGTSDRIRFSVDHRIFIAGLGLYGSIHGPAEYDADIQLFHANTGSVAAKNHTSFVCDGTENTFRVLFKEPVEIQPNVWYIASSTLRGQDSYYGTKGMRRVTVNLPQYNRDPLEPSTVDKITFSFAYAVGQNNGTSVDDGQIPELIFYV